MAAALECLAPEADGQACGHCHACTNLRLRVHPDVRWLEPQGTQHKVEAMRHLVAEAGLSRMAGPYKVYILQQAECITQEGANTLLKLLEEPIPHTVLLLLAEQPDLLLPTIRSRCQRFSFNEQAEEKTVAPEMAAAAFAFLDKLPETPFYQVLKQARTFDKDRAAQEDFLFALLEQVYGRARGENRLSWTRQAALAGAEVLEQALEQLPRGINQKLLVDVTYLRLRQICV